MNCELKARITETNLEVININGFIFNVHKMDVGQLKGFKVLVPIFHDVSEGDCIMTDDWAITRLGDGSDPVDLCVRISKFELLPQEGFETSAYLNGRVVGMFHKSDKCYLRTIGVTKKPFFMATLKIKDAFGVSFPMLITSFGKQAKKMSTVKSASILDCIVTVKRKLREPGYELAVIEFDVVQGVQEVQKS